MNRSFLKNCLIMILSVFFIEFLCGILIPDGTFLAIIVKIIFYSFIFVILIWIYLKQQTKDIKRVFKNLKHQFIVLDDNLNIKKIEVDIKDFTKISGEFGLTNSIGKNIFDVFTILNIDDVTSTIKKCKDKTIFQETTIAFENQKIPVIVFFDFLTKEYYLYLKEREIKIFSENFFEIIFDSIPNSMLMVDKKGNIVLSNKNVQLDFGYRKEEMEKLKVEQLIPHPLNIYHNKLRESYFEYPKHRKMANGREIEGLKKNGLKFPIEVSLSPIATEKGEYAIATILDITKNKEIEKNLKKAKDEAEKTSVLKSEFLNLISHELRTPLTVILGNIPILKNNDESYGKKVIAEVINDIEESANHLLTLINDLLDVSKIEAGKMELKYSKINFKEFMDHLVQQFKPLILDKALEIKVDVKEFVINADEIRLKQIMINLISNAIKFTEKGMIQIKVEEDIEYFYISVEDTGVGISNDDLKHLFENFKQINSIATRKYGGSGLGLLITKKLIQLHGGTIEVKSKLGKGSLFIFSIPKIKGESNGKNINN